MPLQYIIDAYNTINHIQFSPIRKKINPAPARRSGVNPEGKPQRKKEDLIKPELNYSQINKINQELKALWLKK